MVTPGLYQRAGGPPASCRLLHTGRDPSGQREGHEPSPDPLLGHPAGILLRWDVEPSTDSNLGQHPKVTGGLLLLPPGLSGLLRLRDGGDIWGGGPSPCTRLQAEPLALPGARCAREIYFTQGTGPKNCLYPKPSPLRRAESRDQHPSGTMGMATAATPENQLQQSQQQNRSHQ